MGEQNAYLNKAKSRKDDECYTRMSDIEMEMRHYRRHFKNKVIYCNCDDPRESKFYQHFKQKFDVYGLKEVITTCYMNDSPDFFSKHDSNESKGVRYDGKRSLSLSQEPVTSQVRNV